MITMVISKASTKFSLTTVIKNQGFVGIEDLKFLKIQYECGNQVGIVCS